MLNKVVSGLVLSLTLLLSCFPARKLTAPEQIDAQEVLETLRSNEKNLHSLALLLEFKFKGKGKKLSTEAEVFYKEPETYTVYFKSSSHLNILKSVFRNDSVLFYLPETNEYYLDSYENFSQTKGWEWGIEPKDFLNLLVGKNGMAENDLKFIKREKNKLVFVSENDLYEKRFWVDHGKNRLVRCEWRNKKNGDSLMRIEYKRHKDYNGQSLPGFLEIKIPRHKETLKIWFKKRRINLPIPEERFGVRIPSDADRVWLKEKD